MVYKTWDAANLDGKQQHRPLWPYVSTWKGMLSTSGLAPTKNSKWTASLVYLHCGE